MAAVLSGFCFSSPAAADVDAETTAVAADVQCRAEVNPSAFFALHIEEAPVARPLILSRGE
mgnify:CR=1 FL=1